MQDYINRLIRCGMSPSEAYRTYHDFLREYSFSYEALEAFLSDLEDDCDVEILQS